MSKVRINDLARELEVKSRSILDSLTEVGVTEKKTHSSSLEGDEAERVQEVTLPRSVAADQEGKRPERDVAVRDALVVFKYDTGNTGRFAVHGYLSLHAGG